MASAEVSVVIPTYNSGPLLVEAVESVLAQAVPAAEILVVDDGSTDDTRRRMAAYAGRVTYLHQDNRGVSAARNRGVAEASGEFVAFLDGDDVWHPRKLELQMAAFAAAPGLGMIGTGCFAWPSPEMPGVDDAPGAVAPTPVPWRRLVVRNAFATSSVVVRRAVLDAVGEFDTALQGPEDFDFWIRMGEVAELARLERPLTGYRMVQGSLSKQAARMRDGLGRILAKLDARGAWGGDRALRRKAYSYVDYTCSYIYREAGQPLTATWAVLRSLARYPWPYRRDEVRMPLARVKLLATSLLRAVRPARDGDTPPGAAIGGAMP